MNENEPAGLDEFLAAENPQSAVAAQGLAQTGQVIGNVAQQQWQQGGQNIHNALQQANTSDYSGIQNMAIQNAAGTLGEMPPAEGLLGKAQKMFPEAKTLPDLSKAVGASELSEAHPISQAVQQAVNRSKGLANGGELQQFADGGEATIESANALQPPLQSEPSGLDEFLGPELNQQKYGTPGQQAITAAESLGKGLFGPLATAAETAAGVKPEDILGREQANPVTHYGAEIAGLAGPALLTGGASAAARFTQAGLLEAGAKALAIPAAETLAGKIGQGAAKAAIDNMLIQGSDEASRMILKDPSQSAQTAISDIGLAGLLGGALGATGSGAAALWKSSAGGATGRLIEDFKSRVNEHVTNPDPVAAMHQELSDYYTNVKGAADEVYGPAGLKAQDIEKAMPEMSPKISEQMQGIANKMQDTLQSMTKDEYTYPPRLTQMLQRDFDNFSERVTNPDAKPADLFNAAQDLKQTLQGYSKFDKRIAPFAEEAGFVKNAKQLQSDLRGALEDTGVWGNAAKRQNSINGAFKEYLPALKDFEKRFTTEVGGEKVVDPAKVNTYLNQVGKPNAEIKQQMLKNFLDASEKYKKVIGQTHANLGMDSPIPESALNVTNRSFGKQTLGSKLADAFIAKGLTEGTGKTIGAAIGGTLGHIAGVHAGVGALLGSHVLGPFFQSALPAIAKAVVGRAGSAEGFKAATDFAVSAATGHSLLTKGAKNIFKAGVQVLPQAAMPSDTDRAKLNKYIMDAQTNPDKMFRSDDKLNHYMPDHSMAMNQTVGTAVTYLNSLRAPTAKQSPLDSKPVPSSTQKSQFENALNIAQQPLVVLDKIKQGTLTATDIHHLSTMYPSLYNGIKDQLMQALTDHVAKDRPVSYQTRIGLSMFLAQPMDSTMTPASILAAQLAPPVSPQPQQAQSKGTKSSPALQKMPNMYQTPGQSRQQHQLKD